MKEKKRIAVLFGGCSPEYSVSLQSAAGVLENLDEERFQPLLLGISREGDWYCYRGGLDRLREDRWLDPSFCVPAALSPNRSRKEVLLFPEGGVRRVAIDALFPVLHGQNGEDGTVQGLCQLAGIPLVGCGTLASALCMDKERAHRLAEQAGVRAPRSVLLHRDFTPQQARQAARQLGYPLFVKPLRAGSSFGVSRVSGQAELLPALEKAFSHDRQALLEEAVPGFEVGCAVLGRKTLLTGELDEIELQGDFFDYTEKYRMPSARIHVPARVSPADALRLRQTAETVYRALDCRGFARVDLFFTPAGEIVFNEVNTIPGFTPHSRFAAMLQAAGLPFRQVLTRIVEEALQE